MNTTRNRVLQAASGIILLPVGAFAQTDPWLAEVPHLYVDIFALVMFVAFWILSITFVRHRYKARAEKNKCDALASVMNERDDALRKAEESHQKYRSIFDLAPVAIFRTSLDGSHFLEANMACVDLFGAESYDVFMREVTPLQLYPDPAVRSAALDVLRQYGRINGMDLELCRADNSIIHLSMSAVLYEKEGYIEGVAVDVTDLKEAEEMNREATLFLQTLLDAIPNPLFYKDKEGRYQLVNEAFEHMLGLMPDEIIGKSVYDISPKELADTYAEMDNILLYASGPAVQRYDYQVRSHNSLRDVIFNKETVIDEKGNVTGLIGVILDITEQKRTERALRIAEERFRNLFMNAVEGIFTATEDGRYTAANPAMAQMLGYGNAQELLSSVTSIGTQVFVRPEQRDELCRLVHERNHVNSYEAELKRKDGSVFWAAFSVRGIFNLHGEMDRIEGLVIDITAQKTSEHKLEELAKTDPLTGLANRLGFNRAMENMLRQAERSQCHLGMLFLDLDGFKAINDMYGHHIGDDLLCQAADRIRSRMRGSDVAARMGGDEFAVILWDVESPEDVESVAQDILSQFAGAFECQGNACDVGVSIGGALSSLHGATLESMLQAADKAMYKAKEKRGLFVMAAGPSNDTAPLPGSAA